MKALQEICFSIIASNITSHIVEGKVHLLPPSLKTKLLERILWHDLLTEKVINEVLTKQFFHDVTALRLPQNLELSDELLINIAEFGGKLRELLLVVPISDRSRRSQVTSKGLAAILSHQDQLEELHLVWCIGFQSGVLKRIRSKKLIRVWVSGDSFCRCVLDTHPLLRFERVAQDPYQREFGVLAVNNPNISFLSLDGVLLDMNECSILLSNLAETLKHLEVKALHNYRYCQRNHAFYGSDFIAFLEMVDFKCKKLEYLSCYSHSADFQSKQLVMRKCATLRTLSLEGHYFQMPLILPECLEKVKISLNGVETCEHFSALARLPKLWKLHIYFSEDFSPVYSGTMEYMFELLGSSICGITGLHVAPSNTSVCFLIENYCLNLKRLGLKYRTETNYEENNSGSVLFKSLFSDKTRCSTIRWLHLGIPTLPPVTLAFISDYCTGLKYLDLAYCKNLSDTCLENIAQNCADLEILDISKCELVTDIGVISVARKCKKLTCLSFFGVKISDRAILALAMYSPHLTVVGGVHCDSVSDGAKEKLKSECIKRVII